MPRAAGDSSFYELAIIDAAGTPKGVSQFLPSVTTILEALPKYLQWWGYKLGVEATLDKIGELPPGTVLPTVDQMYTDLKADKKLTPSSVLTAAGTRGSDVHDWIEKRVLEHASEWPATPLPSHKGYEKAVNDWLETSGISKVLYTELPVFSMKHQYAGTLDALTYDAEKDEFVVNDWKTNEKGGVYESHHLQIAAYKAAVLEMSLPVEFKNSPVRGRVVAFSAKGKFNEVWVDDEVSNIDTFLKVKEVWEWLQTMQKK